MNSSRAHSPARGLSSGGGRYAALPALFLALVLVGCPSGFVQTESGATVAASTVHAQDLVGNGIKALQDAHNASVDAHDALMHAHLAALEAQDPVAIEGDVEFRKVHAARRAKLMTNAAALRSGWDGLSAWKLGTEGAGMVAITNTLRPALPDLLTVAVGLKVIPQAYADAIGAFFGTAATGKTPAALPKAGGAS